MNIQFNISDIIILLYKFVQGNVPVAVLYDSDNVIFRDGSVTYYTNYNKLQEVLALNVDGEYDEDFVSTVIAKHVINQLVASMGKKAFQDIKTHPSDLNQN